MPRRIFILNGHPGEQSLSKALTESYCIGAQKSDHEVKLMNLSEMEFDIDFGGGGYQSSKQLEPALGDFLDNLKWCEHFVIATPIWWGGFPAKLKGLFDRVLLPGEAFDTRNTRFGFPLPLLSGRSARAFVTSDTPGWAFWFLYRNAFFVQLRKQLFAFVGLKPTRITHLSPAGKANSEDVEVWLAQATQLGENAR